MNVADKLQTINAKDDAIMQMIMQMLSAIDKCRRYKDDTSNVS